jgi:hypothetical protein
MRIHFDLGEFDPMTFEHNGVQYLFSDLTPLAEKRRLSTNIHEYVYRLPDEQYIYVTIVGDDEQPSSSGIHRGWYVIELLSGKEALFLIDALSKFTARHQ